MYLEDSWVIDVVARPGSFGSSVDGSYFVRWLKFIGLVRERCLPPGPTGEGDCGSFDELTLEGTRYRAVADFGRLEVTSPKPVQVEWVSGD